MTLPAWIAAIGWCVLGVGLLVAVGGGQARGRGDITAAAGAKSMGSAIVTLAVVVVAVSIEGSPSLTFEAVRWLGSALSVCGCALALWTYADLGADFSAESGVKARHARHADGPYRISRHPAYTGILLLLIGSALAFGYLVSGGIVVAMGLLVACR